MIRRIIEAICGRSRRASAADAKSATKLRSPKGSVRRSHGEGKAVVGDINDSAGCLNALALSQHKEPRTGRLRGEIHEWRQSYSSGQRNVQKEHSTQSRRSATCSSGTPRPRKNTPLGEGMDVCRKGECTQFVAQVSPVEQEASIGLIISSLNINEEGRPGPPSQIREVGGAPKHSERHARVNPPADLRAEWRGNTLVPVGQQ